MVRPMVMKIAAKVAYHTPANVSGEELENVGLYAAVAASKRFDPSRGTTMNTFLSRRVWGAMMDELREIDHISRLGRTRAKISGKALPLLLSMETSPHHMVPTTIRDRSMKDPSTDPHSRELLDWLFKKIGDRLGWILWKYHIENYTLKEVGRFLHLSESRVCQLHALAVGKLKPRFLKELNRRRSAQ